MKLGKIGKDGKQKGAIVYIDGGWSLLQLKNLAKKYGLPVSGTRPKLQARIQKHVDKLRRDAQRQYLKEQKEAKREARKRKLQERAESDGPTPPAAKKRKSQRQEEAEEGGGGGGGGGGGREQEPPAWATFLKGIDLDAISFKRVKALAKRARVRAGGGRAACVERLRGYLCLSKPPSWWLQAEAKAALVLTLDDADANRKISMRVGQELRIDGRISKCSSTSAGLESAKPAGCVVESRRPKRETRVFGRFKMIFAARKPGHAVVHVLKNSQGAQDAMRPLTREGEPVVITVSAV